MNILYILRYTCAGFEIAKKKIITHKDLSPMPVDMLEYVHTPNEGYITYSIDGTRTNIVRETKLNRVLKIGDFTYCAYFTDPKNYSKLKAEMCDVIDKDIRQLESLVYRQQTQYKEFLYSKLGENL